MKTNVAKKTRDTILFYTNTKNPKSMIFDKKKKIINLLTVVLVCILVTVNHRITTVRYWCFFVFFFSLFLQRIAQKYKSVEDGFDWEKMLEERTYPDTTEYQRRRQQTHNAPPRPLN